MKKLVIICAFLACAAIEKPEDHCRHVPQNNGNLQRGDQTLADDDAVTGQKVNPESMNCPDGKPCEEEGD